ncbi:LOW QUALITY PROTEIN: poly [ADP-ribose] polymerase 1-like [Liolophura sinensis]|uniref:LOW QUALITY PROTEIN: poly [ADP-ribose] polymerase 1-like n=1 Tax=Liolophura sinensis TaxID=3198878 RepID=UPI0031586A58
MGDHPDYPFKAEYAKSGRASCKTCKSSIAQDSLRIAVMVQSPMFDGKIPNWNHYACFWKRNRVSDPQEIHGFDSLRWEDQQKIKEKIEGSGGGGGGGDDGAGAAQQGDFKAEYAKSSRSTCRGCEEKIDKDVVRVSKKDFSSERAKMYGPQDLWYHLACFAENRDELGFGTDLSPDSIVGFSKLKKEDKDEIINVLGKGEKKKKRKAKENKGGSEGKKSKIETEEEKSLREQSQLLWSIRDNLTKHVSNDALKGLLEYNNQEVMSGGAKLLDLVSDCMAFGALQKCPECEDGQLVYSTTGYRCTGNITSWTKCVHQTKTPKRKPFKVPSEYHDVPFLKKYKYVKRERVFPTVTLDLTDGPVSSSQGSGNGSLRPLEGMKFALIGKTVKSKTALTKEISSLGGDVVSKVDGTLAACISTKAEVEKNSKGIKDAKKADVQVVDEGFLEACRKGGAALMIQQRNLCSWGSDPLRRISEPSTSKKSSGKSEATIKRDEAMFTKSVPDKLKMMVKGGAAVDPDSGLAETAHVINEKGVVYNAVLGLVDVAKGTNSYYKIQALESDSSKACWLFKAWGRVGTTIGGNRLEKCSNARHAIDAFKQLYAEKTRNEWENRHEFIKYPNKFYPLEIDYGDDDENLKIDLSTSKSKLDKAIQDLVQMIFDIESMKKAMKEFEIDLKKMPLGKLSKRQIESAYSVLSELQKLIEEGGSQTKFLDASNRFYTLIPHDFGMRKMPLLDTPEIIKTKTEMLANLLDIEVAYSLLKGGQAGEDPIDAHYKQLKTDMQVLDKKSEEFRRLVDYVKNTHAATHNQYDLEILEAIRITREGEEERYSPFRELGNRQLLWHGSRTTNFAGILSQGLRIAPPEAPVTGYMFGKGIYFADMVSKSANYCRTSKSDPVGLMLLCEVALGNMHELTGASYITKLPKGKHSTKGVGMTAPDPSQSYVTEDGLIIPMGKGVSLPSRSSLLYNEYIVYDISQVSMKYLLKMNFDFKW